MFPGHVHVIIVEKAKIFDIWSKDFQRIVPTHQEFPASHFDTMSLQTHYVFCLVQSTLCRHLAPNLFCWCQQPLQCIAASLRYLMCAWPCHPTGHASKVLRFVWPLWRLLICLALPARWLTIVLTCVIGFRERPCEVGNLLRHPLVGAFWTCDSEWEMEDCSEHWDPIAVELLERLFVWSAIRTHQRSKTF